MTFCNKCGILYHEGNCPHCGKKGDSEASVRDLETSKSGLKKTERRGNK